MKDNPLKKAVDQSISRVTSRHVISYDELVRLDPEDLVRLEAYIRSALLEKISSQLSQHAAIQTWEDQSTMSRTFDMSILVVPDVEKLKEAVYDAAKEVWYDGFIKGANWDGTEANIPSYPLDPQEME